jgi:hypothetical protein
MATTQLFSTAQINNDPDQTGLPPQSTNGTLSSINSTSGSGSAVASSAGVLRRISGKWFQFPSAPSGTINSINLGLKYSLMVANSGFLSANDFGRIFIDYSLDNGSSWIPLVNLSFNTSNQSLDNAQNVSLSTSQNPNLVRVRTRAEAFKNNAGNLQAFISLSDIRMDVDYTPPPPPPPTAQIPQVIIMM